MSISVARNPSLYLWPYIVGPASLFFAKCSKYIFSVLFGLFSVTAWAEVNVDPRVKGIVVDVDAISVTGTTGDIGEGVTLRQLMIKANLLRGLYPKQMKFSQLQEITDELTLYLRDQGFKFHYAFIPPQDPESGIITISIIEVNLSDVRITNASYFPDKKVQSLFQSFIDKPLYQPDIDDVLRALERNPDLTFFAYYSRGSKPSSVRLNIKVSAKSRWSGGLSLDNYGPSSSGKNRASLQFAVLNPFNRFDYLSVGLLNSFGGASNNNGYLHYKTALASLQHELSLYASNSAFEIGGDFSQFGVEGDAFLGELAYTNYFYDGKNLRQSFSLSYAQKQNDFSNSLDGEDIIADERGSSAGLTWSMDYGGELSHQRLQTRAYLGDYEKDNSTYDTASDSSFNRFNIDYQYYQRFKQSASTFAFESRLRYQHSTQSLPVFERISMMGVAGVRGFESGQYSADKAALLALTLHFPRLQFGGGAADTLTSINSNVFVQWGSGTQFSVDATVPDNELNISSIGLELRANWGSHVFASISYATPIGSDVAESAGYRSQPLLLSMTIKR